MDDNIKKYDLKASKVIILLIISIIAIMAALYMLFIATNKEKFDMFINDLIFSIRQKQAVFGSVYTCGFFAILIGIYMLQLLMYKIKGVLVLSHDGIKYYAPEYGEVYISKDKIEDIYITSNDQMKIKLKNYELKRSFRAKLWTSLKDIILGSNPKTIFRINLNFIKCDIKEVREYLMQFELDAGSEEAKEEIKDILEKYNYKNLEELKIDEKALGECVMKLYKMEKFTQLEIASILKISANKVSKLIRKGLSEDN